MDRYWFLTWRAYGTWLPGEDGFVGYYRPVEDRRVIDNMPGEPTAEPIPSLERYAKTVMQRQPVLLTVQQAKVILAQLQETAAYRGWIIDAVAVMSNHVHVVYGVPGDPDPSDMLRDWKSYSSRELNRIGGKPQRGRWWADGGSKRPIKTDARRLAAICYVRDQIEPLLVWLSPEARQLTGEPAA